MTVLPNLAQQSGALRLFNASLALELTAASSELENATLETASAVIGQVLSNAAAQRRSTRSPSAPPPPTVRSPPQRPATVRVGFEPPGWGDRCHD